MGFTEWEREIIRLWLDGKSQTEIARELGLTQQRINQVVGPRRRGQIFRWIGCRWPRGSYPRAPLTPGIQGGRWKIGPLKREPDRIDEMAWRWHKQGVTYAEIGRRLGGITKQAVYYIINRWRPYFEEHGVRETDKAMLGLYDENDVQIAIRLQRRRTRARRPIKKEPD